MRRAVLALALLLGVAGCRTAPPPQSLALDDPRPRALLDAWAATAGGRETLRAVARFAVDAPGAGVGGRDLRLRIKQRLWLARPSRLRVEVLGFFDATVAVLATDGEHYALLQASDRALDTGPVYDRLLWDAARLDLTPGEAVEVILGASRPDEGLLLGSAYAMGDATRIELADESGRLHRIVEFGGEGRLLRLEQRDLDGAPLWDARFDDYVDVGGTPFARDVTLRSGSGDTRALLSLRSVVLNPALSGETFRLRAPGTAGEGG